MITALIIVGLLIDLGGLPNDKLPIGFLVRLCASSGSGVLIIVSSKALEESRSFRCPFIWT
jgi:hypothetical protein